MQYDYDPAGNRLLQTDHLNAEVTTYAYNAANQLLMEENSSGVTTYTYDADGNRTQKESFAELTDYNWDELNRLVLAEPVSGVITYIYNSAGQLLEKQTATETVRYVYDFTRLIQQTDGADDPLFEYTFTGNNYGDLVSEYRFGDDASGFATFDAIGSTEHLLDENEAITDTWKQTAFGFTQQHTGSSEQPFTYVGKQGYQFDHDLNLYLLGLGGNSAASPGVYDPTTGQFVRKDPIGPNVDDLRNVYRYVENNPVNVFDPSGSQRNSTPNEDIGTYKRKLFGNESLIVRTGGGGFNESGSEANQPQDPNEPELLSPLLLLTTTALSKSESPTIFTETASFLTEKSWETFPLLVATDGESLDQGFRTLAEVVNDAKSMNAEMNLWNREDFWSELIKKKGLVGEKLLTIHEQGAKLSELKKTLPPLSDISFQYQDFGKAVLYEINNSVVSAANANLPNVNFDTKSGIKGDVTFELANSERALEQLDGTFKIRVEAKNPKSLNLPQNIKIAAEASALITGNTMLRAKEIVTSGNISAESKIVAVYTPDPENADLTFTLIGTSKYNSESGNKFEGTVITGVIASKGRGELFGLPFVWTGAVAGEANATAKPSGRLEFHVECEKASLKGPIRLDGMEVSVQLRQGEKPNFVIATDLLDLIRPK